MLQSLEARRLFAVTTTLDAGLLTVNGTPQGETIQVDVLENGVTVTANGSVIFQSAPFSLTVFAGVVVNAGGGKDTIGSFLNGSTYAITANGQGGADTVDMHSFHGPGAIVNGGEGDDLINTETQLGGGAGSTISGGRGDDTITTKGANGSPGSLVNCGAGDDRVTCLSGPGAGSSGHTVHGNEGDDIIHGGELADNLSGDEGRDRLFGGDGDDQLHGGPGRDRIDGEAGTDTADASKHDLFFNVENFV